MIYDYDIQPALIRPQRLSNMYPFPTRQGFEEFFLQNHQITDPAGRVSVFFLNFFVGFQNLKGMHGGEWRPKKFSSLLRSVLDPLSSLRSDGCN